MQPHVACVVVNDSARLRIGVVHKHGVFLVGVFGRFSLGCGDFVNFR